MNYIFLKQPFASLREIALRWLSILYLIERISYLTAPTPLTFRFVKKLQKSNEMIQRLFCCQQSCNLNSAFVPQTVILLSRVEPCNLTTNGSTIQFFDFFHFRSLIFFHFVKYLRHHHLNQVKEFVKVFRMPRTYSP